MASTKKRGLGKGLGALIGDTEIDFDETVGAPAPTEALADGSRLIEIDPTALRPNPKQPRRVFDEDALAELAESIRRDGMQEPVIVRRAGDEYELVSGERRVRAAVMAEVERVPAVVREVYDRDMLKLGLIENIQREDLNPIELAHAYQALIEEFEWTQEEMADEVGKNRATVTNTLRLLHLPDMVQEQVADGTLSMGHAKALLAIATPEAQAKAARRIVQQGLSVRQAEKLANETKPKPKAQPKKDPNVAQVEDDLRRRFGTRVHLKPQRGGKGRIEIEYFSADELDRILEVLQGRQ